jgi:nucleoside-diphosphate-sugar epimerase
MGGMGFIHSAESDIMRNNALININMIYSASAVGVKRYFFSSSVCIYRDMKLGEPELKEEDAYPASADNEYGWEKLYAERMALVYAKKYGFTVRIARFQNCYGPEGTWQGGREKAPAAICRKVAQAKEASNIEVWGDGRAVRSYTFITDMIAGIRLLMQSDLEGPVNIGSPEYVSVKELVDIVIAVAGKHLNIKWVKGPVGVESRNFSNERIQSIGWRPKVSLREGIQHLYVWIEEQVRKAKLSA